MPTFPDNPAFWVIYPPGACTNPAEPFRARASIQSVRSAEPCDEKIHDPGKRVEPERLRYRPSQIRIRVHVIKHEPSVGSLEIFDPTYVKTASGDDTFTCVHRSTRHCRVREELDWLRRTRRLW
jgi:hypothetical protein